MLHHSFSITSILKSMYEKIRQKARNYMGSKSELQNASLGMPKQAQDHLSHHEYLHCITLYYFIQKFKPNSETVLEIFKFEKSSKKVLSYFSLKALDITFHGKDF